MAKTLTKGEEMADEKEVTIREAMKAGQVFVRWDGLIHRLFMDVRNYCAMDLVNGRVQILSPDSNVRQLPPELHRGLVDLAYNRVDHPEGWDKTPRYNS